MRLVRPTPPSSLEEDIDDKEEPPIHNDDDMSSVCSISLNDEGRGRMTTRAARRQRGSSSTSSRRAGRLRLAAVLILSFVLSSQCSCHAMLFPFLRFPSRLLPSRKQKAVQRRHPLNLNSTTTRAPAVAAAAAVVATSTNSTTTSETFHHKRHLFVGSWFPRRSKRLVYSTATARASASVAASTDVSITAFETTATGVAAAAAATIQQDEAASHAHHQKEEEETNSADAKLGAQAMHGLVEDAREGSASTRSSSATAVKEENEAASHKESVHLKLGSEAMTRKIGEEDDEEKKKDDKQKKRNIATLHSYYRSGKNSEEEPPLYLGLNMHKRKFSAWVNYTLQNEGKHDFDASRISSREIQLDDENIRNNLREYWKQGRLLSERTEVLAVYPSDTKDGENSSNPPNKKRGGFADLLHLYAQRLAAIIRDELEEEQIASGQIKVFNDTSTGNLEPIPEQLLHILNGGLLGWLQREYGQTETLKLMAGKEFDNLSEKQQIETLQNFMDWFRNRFPYYYDRCDVCGASAKDEPPPVVVAQVEDEEQEEDPEEENTDKTESDDDNHDNHDDDGSFFLGYVYPTPTELLGKASRTEVYQCGSCGSFTRFPRYNSASSIIQHRRGRCGEYSMLLFRFLRACGHSSRWIVDWADHVWAEVRLNGRWIHLDPCEAAVDKPLLYQEWGKQQTYIVAFHAPQSTSSSSAAAAQQPKQQSLPPPLIEDVTTQYTSDNVNEIQKRREESKENVVHTVEKITNDLEVLLKDLLQ